MVSRRIPVSRIIELQLRVSWQEAVAIAGEVDAQCADARAKGEAAPRVDPDACHVTPLGEVVLSLPAAGEAPHAPLDLLRALLAGREMPADLEAIVYGPPPPSLSDALAMFSRPSRRADIAAVALRALSAEQDLEPATDAPQTSALEAPPAIPDPAPVPDEVSDLRAQVSTRPPVAAPPPPAPRRTRSPRALLIPAAIVATLLAGVLVALRWTATRPSAPEEAAAPVAAVDTLPEIIPQERGSDAAQRVTDIALGRPGRRPRPMGDGRPGADALGDASAAAPTVGNGAPDGSAEPPADAAPAPPAPEPATTEPPVYSWRSPDVEPPELVFPRMPRSAFPAPGVPVDGAYVEVLVSEAGEVEAVRLRGTAASTASAHRHAMLLAAAKAWQFTPARRNDVPVRYVARVFVEP